MLTRPLARVWRIILFLCVFWVPLFPCHAAQFTAELTISSPQENFVYDLKVKDNLIRLEKTQGPMTVPPFPTIYNRSTGITWGLNPQLRQYVEESDPVKTMMMNPVFAWSFMRKDMAATPAGTETVAGYACQVVEYRKSGSAPVSNRVWVSRELDFTVKEIAYGMNGSPTMELRNIKAGNLDAALFKIPPGYTNAGDVPGSAGRSAIKPAKAKKPLSTTVSIKSTSTHAIGLEPDRTITITATGEDPGGALSTAGMKVLGKDKSTILSEQVTLKKGETQTWAVPAEKLPYDLYLNGGKGQVRFTVEQPAEYKLVPDTYALKVTDRSVTPFQHQQIRDIEIVSGQTVEKTIDFIAGGVLRITATRNGQPFDAQASVYRQNDNKSIGAKSTWYRGKPAEYMLVPGIYYISVYDRKTKEKKEIRNVEIGSGQAVEKTAAF